MGQKGGPQRLLCRTSVRRGHFRGSCAFSEKAASPVLGPFLAQCPSAPFLPQSHVQFHAQLWQEKHAFLPAKLTCHKRHCTGRQGKVGVPASWPPETPPPLNSCCQRLGPQQPLWFPDNSSFSLI